MKTVGIKQKIKFVVLILTFGMHTVLATDNIKLNTDGGSLENGSTASSAREEQQNKADKLRRYLEKQRLDKQERKKSREKAKQKLLGGNMQTAVNDICLKYRTHPQSYAKTYDAIATMNPSIAGAMNTVIEACGDKQTEKDLDIELVQSVLLELFKLSALKPDQEHFILRGFEICDQLTNNSEYSKKYSEVIAFHKTGNRNISNAMDSVMRACADLSSSRFYEHEVTAIATYLNSYEKDIQAKLDRENNKIYAILRRAADRIKTQAEDRKRYAEYNTINKKIKACESFVQSKIDIVDEAIQSEEQGNRDSKAPMQHKLGKELRVNYEGSQLIASTLHKTLVLRKESCATRFDLSRKRSDFVNAHQRPASHQNKTIDEILVLIEQEKTQKRLGKSKEEKYRNDALSYGDIYEAADVICAKYKADPNVYARAYNAIAEMNSLVVVPMDYVIGYCEGKILRNELNQETVKRVMYELNKPYIAERNTDLYILRGLDICERYKHDADYSKTYDDVIASLYPDSDLHVMKSMIKSTCLDLSKKPIKKLNVQKIESFIYNYEQSKNSKSAPQ